MPQHATKEVMVAVPVSLVGERNEEQVSALQLFEDELTVRIDDRRLTTDHRCGWAIGCRSSVVGRRYPKDGITQRSAPPVADRGLQQKPLNVRRLTGKDLVHQVVGHKPITPGESLEKVAIV